MCVQSSMGQSMALLSVLVIYHQQSVVEYWQLHEQMLQSKYTVRMIQPWMAVQIFQFI